MRGGTALFGSLASLALLAGCGGSGGGGIASTPAPTPAPAPAPTPTDYDTAEYNRSNGAVAAGAIAAYRAGASGANIVVAVIDSGVDSSNSEFAGRISPLSRDVAGSSGTSDADGHGTEVAGILLAARNNFGIQGVAYDATLLALRAARPGSCASSDGCAFPTSAIATGFDVATSAHARVINVSLGGSPATPTLDAAVNRATSAGAVVVVSAGNDGNAEVDPLAASILAAAAPGTVIIAGALDGSGALATFSNKAGVAANSYLGALGVDVRSFDNKGVAYLYSGTSEAAPIISGAVALLAQAFPNLTGAQIVDLLLRTADDAGTPGTDSTYGRGAINIARAFAPNGALTVAKVAAPITANAGTLGGALGDGGATAMALSKVVAHDSYDRAYIVNVAASLRQAPTGRLAMSLLTTDAQTSAGAIGAMNLSVAVRSQGPLGWRGDVLTGATSPALQPNQLLSGGATVSFGAHGGAAFGFGQSLSNLVDSAGGTYFDPGNLVAVRASDPGFQARQLGGGAVAQHFAGWTATIGIGELAVATPGFADAARSSRAVLRLSRAVGTISIAASGELLVEHGTLLGSRLSPAFGVNGATTSSATLGILAPFGDWTLMGEARIGVTNADLGSGIIAHTGSLVGTAASLTLAHDAVLTNGDRASITVAQPMRLSGNALLQLGGDAPVETRLGPSGREVAFEAQYGRPLGRGFATFGLFWRQDPGHIAGTAPDAGAAIRYRVRL